MTVVEFPWDTTLPRCTVTGCERLEAIVVEGPIYTSLCSLHGKLLGYGN